MKITLLYIGKTEEEYLKTGCKEYENRIKHYLPFEIIVIPALKNAKNYTPEVFKSREAELLEKYFNKTDFIVLLDENGKDYNSVEFSGFINQKMNLGIKNLVFIIGGPFGFDDKIYKICNFKIALSKMTFSHQLVRLVFLEQLYRAMTIIKNESYHH